MLTSQARDVSIMKPPLWCSRKARDGWIGLVGPVRDMDVEQHHQVLLSS
jgi:hypothetical protein